MYTSETDKHTQAPSLSAAIDIELRPVEAGDIHFILDSWLKSYRDAVRNVSDDDYFKHHQALIAAIASRSSLVVACDKETPAFILGYVCGELLSDSRGILVHYAYTKQNYRCHGIMRDLLKLLGWNPDMRIYATHWNRAATALAQKFNMTYNPYPLMIGHTDEKL